MSPLDRHNDTPLYLNTAMNHLFVMQQHDEDRDSLLVLDLAQGGEMVMVEPTKAQVHSFRLNGNHK